MITVGSFLRQKLSNMAEWLRAEGVCANGLDALQDVQIVALAQHLHDNYADAIEVRVFEPIMEDKENIPPHVLKIVQSVEERPPLHDKFWRYLKLFSDTVKKGQ